MGTKTIKRLYTNKVTLEDLELGDGVVQQVRGGQVVNRHKINLANIPQGEVYTSIPTTTTTTTDTNLGVRLNNISQDHIVVPSGMNGVIVGPITFNSIDVANGSNLVIL